MSEREHQSAAANSNSKKDSERQVEPALARATETLRSAVDEACSVDVERIDTGELIRVEEVLAIANEAAKEVISVRRRARVQPEAASVHNEQTSTTGSTQSRMLTDSTGRQWTVFAVYPSASRGRAVLREGYADGWLSFDDGDETRRVAPIPEGWEQLPEATLLTLCADADRSRPRRRPKGA